MQDKKVAAVIGDGSMAAECARIIAAHEGMTVGLIVHHEGGPSSWSSQIEKASRDGDIPRVAVANVNDETAVRALTDVRPDIVFSANNWDVIRPDILGIPADGVFNFHNGPLPGYRGVNVPSWAIFNREVQYSVAWHVAGENVDSGGLVATASFDLEGDETAISLIFRCIDTGIKLLPGLLDQYLAGTLTPAPQQGAAGYYRAGDTPNDGYLDFTWDFERLSALVRALTFHPFPSPMTAPRIAAGRHVLPVTGIVREGDRGSASQWTAGEVRRIDDGEIVVCAADSFVRVRVLLDAQNEVPVDPASAGTFGLGVGTVLAGR